MVEAQSVTQKEEKINFFLKHYIFTSIVVVYVFTYVSHVLAIQVTHSAKYLSIFVFAIFVIFITYFAAKEKRNDKIWKKFVSATVAFIGALFLLTIVQGMSNTGIKGLQDIYIKKLETNWTAHVESENFMEELSAYASENADSLTEDELLDIALEYQQTVFIPAFNEDNQALSLFILPANYKN